MAERQRTGISILGLDTAAPDHSVDDGKCEQLYNLRFTGGAWRNVHPFATKYRLNNLDGYKILYHHPATNENQYIAESNRVEDVTNFYAFMDRFGELWHFKKENIVAGDAVYDDGYSYIGTVVSVNSQQTYEVVYADNNGAQYSIDLTRAADEDVKTSTEVHYISLIEIDGSEIKLVQDIYDMKLAGNPQISISHFGKVLIISDKTNKKLLYFILKSGQYTQIDWSVLSCQSSINVLSFNSPNINTINVEKWEGNTLPDYGFTEAGLLAYEQISEEGNPNPTFITFDEDLNAWRGEIAIFFALRDASGAIIHTTSPQILRSTLLTPNTGATPDIIHIGTLNVVDESNTSFAFAGYKNISADLRPGTNHPYAAPFHKLIKPTVKLDYNIGNSGVITEIAIYSTRLYSLLDTNGEDRVDLLQEPFYLMDAISINPKVLENFIEYDISYSKLKNIEQKPLYSPVISPQLLYTDKFTEYNDRLHLLSPERLLSPLKSDNIALDAIGTDYMIVKWGNDSGSTVYSAAPNRYSLKQGFLITFPQNVDSIYWADGYEDSYEVFGRLLNLKYNAAIDTSYYINLIPKPNTDRVQMGVMANYIFYKYETSLEVDLPNEYVMSVESVLSVADSNRIQVSEANNCFIFPYENSYRIGSNTSHIVTANSAAIEMSDAKFGEFPLYVFTDEGVFAMQSGSGSVLYSAIVPISYDKAIQPNTLAVNYNVLFVTKQGIMALSSQGVNLISGPLNKPDGTIPEWLKTTEFTHIARYNEVLATDLDSGLAYVYSLDSRVWSTRDLDYDTKLSNGEAISGNNIINLNEEIIKETATGVEILTRPIKLGSMELKRLETFILRFESATNQTIKIQLSGSVDTVKWINFREVSVFTNRDIIIRRVPMSAKYLRVRLSGAITEDVKIIAMEMEYYLRMLHRMR